ncbi:MbnP family protein [Dyadobacter sp. 22481]|uniref:MbnP family protein n=1 Tax=Dyadobacter sp. 22481 TaxID=3453926 RepID=UPI003F826BD9
MMKRTFSWLSAWALASGLLMVSCSFPDEKDDTDPIETGTIQLQFDNIVGNQDLQLDSTRYVNASGEDFTVSKLNYYISNIKLTRIDGRVFTVPQDSSYFLIREANSGSQKLTIRNVLTGDYTGIEFMVGIDSLRSVMDPSQPGRKGILDKDTGPTNEEAMYWDWNPGYIFLKLEGASDSATTANGKYYYHIGGFGGRTEKTLNNLKTIKLNFPGQKAIVTTSIVSNVLIQADILKIFNGPTQWSIKKSSGVMFSDSSKIIADNYAGMFNVKEIKIN